MNRVIENDNFIIKISEVGGSMTSIISKDNKEELLWQSDPNVWIRQAPVLFPIVGGLKDGYYIYDGEKYTLPRHGFFSGSKLEVVESSESKVIFELYSNDDTYINYPWKYYVKLSYELVYNSIIVRFEVKNIDDKVMYYQYGGHPGFNIELNQPSWVEFEGDTPFIRYIADGAYISPNTFSTDVTKIDIDAEVFNNDAIILKGVTGATIVQGNKRIHIDMCNMDYLGVWSKYMDGEMGSFVCLEPWTGMGDTVGATGRIEDKFSIGKLEPNEKAEYVFKIDISL